MPAITWRYPTLIVLGLAVMMIAPLLGVGLNRADAVTQRIEIGEIEAAGNATDYDEFASTATAPTHVAGSGTLSTVRQWIGHSTCGACNQGTSHYQRIQLDDLMAGEQYIVAVHPSYVTGTGDYTATVVSGSATIALGDQHHVRQSGYLEGPETWRIQLTASSTSVTIELGNGATSGTDYLYLDAIVVAPNTMRIPATSMATTLGEVEPFDSSAWDEFTATGSLPDHTVGVDDASSLRSWIGHSTCGTCGAGTPNYQRLTFTGLEVGDSYALTIYAASVTGTAYYSALVGAGSATITSGATKYYTGLSGFVTPEARWVVEFTPDTSTVSLDLGHGLTSGNHYLYLNWYDFTPLDVPLQEIDADQYSTTAQTLDTVNSGDWWKDDIHLSGGSYAWGQGYVMNSYVDFYRQSLDDHWLEKLVEHADDVLAQRNSETLVQDCYGETPPAWMEEGNPSGSGYVWIGFTGAMFDPIMDFAAMVLESDHLSSQSPAWLGTGVTLEDKAREYVDAFQEAVDYHESEWVASGSHGWYEFHDDVATTCGIAGGAALAGEPAAFDMNALMMGAVLHLSDAYRGIGDGRATTYEARVAAYARFFRSYWTYQAGADTYVWPFASYYSGVDDIGHANFNVRFVVQAHRAGVEYSGVEVARVANALARLIEDDYAIPHNLMDATYTTAHSPQNNGIFYWSTVAPFGDGLLTEVYGRERLLASRDDPYGSQMFSFARLPLADRRART